MTKDRRIWVNLNRNIALALNDILIRIRLDLLPPPKNLKAFYSTLRIYFPKYLQ